ncbi:MAG: HAMP domain-containing histidine kinase [Oceanospirillaceae bacterium]|nr:HAMP domain-containing histidine kinase [Oceanospirillaceae bacterium]
MLKLFKSSGRTMRRELSNYFLGLALLTALGFIMALMEYFESGLDNASRIGLMMEVRAFDAEYVSNPDAALPTSYNTHFYLDNWDDAPDIYKQIIPFDDLQLNGLVDVEWSPHGIEEWEDSRFLIVYWHKLYDGRDLFVVADYDFNLMSDEEKEEFDSQFFQVFYLSGGYLFVMLLVVWFYNRRVSRHTQKLADWAETLTLETISQTRPDFRYVELNRIAEQLQAAFERIASLLEREHQFLRHASHELRTPIAVIRANMELLDKIGVPEALNRPVDRVRRANHAMLQLTETLLWLSRENETVPTLRDVQIDDLLDDLTEELDYLLQDKSVDILRQYAADLPLLPLPEIPLRIVLSNLLRNAFQYTDEGDVLLELTADRLVIENREHGEPNIDSDQSFGLGLMLVKRICDRLGWSLELHFLEQGVRAELTLPK